MNNIVEDLDDDLPAERTLNQTNIEPNLES